MIDALVSADVEGCSRGRGIDCSACSGSTAFAGDALRSGSGSELFCIRLPLALHST
jgi:hypothetical protein